MARPKEKKSKKRNDEIYAGVLKNINVRFHDDVYVLAVRVAMSDRAKSTSTCQSHTTLHGPANKFASAYSIDYSKPLDTDDIMAISRRRCRMKSSAPVTHLDQGHRTLDSEYYS